MQSPHWAAYWPIASPTFESHLPGHKVIYSLGRPAPGFKVTWSEKKKSPLPGCPHYCFLLLLQQWYEIWMMVNSIHNTKTVLFAYNFIHGNKQLQIHTLFVKVLPGTWGNFPGSTALLRQPSMFGKQLFTTAYLSGYKRGLFNWLCIVLDFLWHLKQPHTLALSYCQHGIGVEHN